MSALPKIEPGQEWATDGCHREVLGVGWVSLKSNPPLLRVEWSGPGRREVQTARSFRRWARRTGARPQEVPRG